MKAPIKRVHNNKRSISSRVFPKHIEDGEDLLGGGGQVQEDKAFMWGLMKGDLIILERTINLTVLNDRKVAYVWTVGSIIGHLPFCNVSFTVLLFLLIPKKFTDFSFKYFSN